jgi:integrase
MKGHIRERSPGRWAIVLEIRDPESGKRKRKWHSFKGTKRGAQLECARLISEVERGTYLQPNKTTLAEFLEQWLTDVKPRVSPKTHERYAQVCRKNVMPLLGAVILAKLKPAQIAAALTKALANGRRKDKGPLSPRTVHHMLTILKSALAQAVKWELLIRNPADAVDAPKVERESMAIYDMHQTAALMETVRGARIMVPVMLAALCGLRRGEIAALKWRSVDLTTGTLAITESAEQTKAGVRYKETKSGRGRTVALPNVVAEVLREHRLQQVQELLRVGVRHTNESFVVAQPDGAPLRPHSLGQEWVRFLKRQSELPRIKFHNLRHSHASHMLQSNVHPKVVSERLGHSKIGITLDLYSQVMPNMQEDAAARIDDALRAALHQRNDR